MIHFITTEKQRMYFSRNSIKNIPNGLRLNAVYTENICL
jgi:hypothetical protein